MSAVGRAAEFDVIVVGGGIVGLCIAYYGRRCGLEVAVMEKGELGREASGRHGGGIRQQHRSEVDYRLAIEARRLWKSFAEERGGDFEFDPCGNMVLAVEGAELAALRASVEVDRSRGLPVEFLDADAVRRLAPGLSDRVQGGSHCPTDAQANPMLAARFLARLARAEGVQFLVNTAVERIDVGKGGMLHVMAGGVGYRGASVVLALGAWVKPLIEPFGLTLPIFPRRTQTMVTTPMAPVLRPWIRANSVWIRQTKRGNVQIGGAGAWEPVGFDKSTTARTIARYARRASSVLPAIERAGILRSWAGTLDMTPDRSPIIDVVPGVENLHLAVGFAGHGFGIAPAVGNLVAERVCGRQSNLDHPNLRLARFPRGLDPLASYRREREPA